MKKTLKMLVIFAILFASLVTLAGCGNEKEDNKSKNNRNENVAEEKNNYTEENEINNTINNTTNNTVNGNTTANNKTVKEVDKTPVDIKDNSSYYFIVNGKKYSAGDKISTLSESGYHLNKTGSEKELQPNGYLIGGDAILNSDNKTVFNATPFNNTKETIKGADAVIGSFYVDESSNEKYNLNVEIVNGITIGTSIEDMEYNGPTYTYDVSGEYKTFYFYFNKEGKITSMKWQAYIPAE